MTHQFYTYIYFDPKKHIPVYVGKGSTNRAWSHLKRTDNPTFDNTIKKRLSEGYVWVPIVIDMPNEVEAFQLERFWIAYYGRANNETGTLFNLTDGGEAPPSRKGWHHTAESKAKLSAALAGKIHSEDTKARMRKPKSEQAKINIKAAAQTRRPSTKPRKPHSAEARNKISQAAKLRPKRTHSEETKERMRVSQQQRRKKTDDK